LPRLVAAVLVLLFAFFVLKIGVVGIVVLVLVGGGGWQLWRYWSRLQLPPINDGGVTVTGAREWISLRGGLIVIAGSEHRLVDARAEVVADGAKEMSVGRVLGGTLLDPGLGTLIGALWQKPVPVLVVTGPDWSETVRFRDLGSAILAARRINEAAARAASPHKIAAT
jgi:hypothetical protein